MKFANYTIFNFRNTRTIQRLNRYYEKDTSTCLAHFFPQILLFPVFAINPNHSSFFAISSNFHLPNCPNNLSGMDMLGPFSEFEAHKNLGSPLLDPHSPQLQDIKNKKKIIKRKKVLSV